MSVKGNKYFNLPSEVELLDNSLVTSNRQFNLQPSFNLDSDVINKQSLNQKIILSQNSWNSDLIYFTNDPFNKPQLLLKSEIFWKLKMARLICPVIQVELSLMISLSYH